MTTLKLKWKKFLANNPQWSKKIGQHHYFRSRYASKFWLEVIKNLEEGTKDIQCENHIWQEGEDRCLNCGISRITTTNLTPHKK